MAFIRRRVDAEGRRPRYQLVESRREGAKVRQIVLAHLGPCSTLAAAIEHFEAQLRPLRDEEMALFRAKGVAKEQPGSLVDATRVPLPDGNPLGRQSITYGELERRLSDLNGRILKALRNLDALRQAHDTQTGERMAG